MEWALIRVLHPSTYRLRLLARQQQQQQQRTTTAITTRRQPTEMRMTMVRAFTAEDGRRGEGRNGESERLALERARTRARGELQTQRNRNRRTTGNSSLECINHVTPYMQIMIFTLNTRHHTVMTSSTIRVHWQPSFPEARC